MVTKRSKRTRRAKTAARAGEEVTQPASQAAPDAPKYSKSEATTAEARRLGRAIADALAEKRFGEAAALISPYVKISADYVSAVPFLVMFAKKLAEQPAFWAETLEAIFPMLARNDLAAHIAQQGPEFAALRDDAPLVWSKVIDAAIESKDPARVSKLMHMVHTYKTVAPEGSRLHELATRDFTRLVENMGIDPREYKAHTGVELSAFFDAMGNQMNRNAGLPVADGDEARDRGTIGQALLKMIM